MPAGFFDVGDTWFESTPTFTQVTVNRKIIGGAGHELTVSPKEAMVRSLQGGKLCATSIILAGIPV